MGNGVRVRLRHLPNRYIAVMAVLVVTVIIGAYLVNAEIISGGVHEQWRFSNGASSNSFFDHLTIQGVEPDGTILVDGYNYGWNDGNSSLMALDPDGHVNWRYGHRVNLYGMGEIKTGTDGSYYFVDFESYDPSTGNRSGANVVALDHDGSLKWRYMSTNGTLSVISARGDGRVVLSHSYEVQVGENLTDNFELVSLWSDNGSVVWKLDLPAGAYYHYFRVDENGTTWAHTTKMEEIIQIEVSRDGSIMGNATVGSFVDDYGGALGDIRYFVWHAYLNGTASVIKVVALNTTTGLYDWKTVLRSSDNPQNYPYGTSVGWSAVTDPTGIIYCPDESQQGNHWTLYAVDRNGTVLWSRPVEGSLIKSFASGGVLLVNGNKLTTIDTEGRTVWQYEVRGNSMFSYIASIETGPDGSVYYGQDGYVIAIGKEGVSWNVIGLAILIIGDFVLVATFLLYDRKRKPSTPTAK